MKRFSRCIVGNKAFHCLLVRDDQKKLIVDMDATSSKYLM